MMVESFRKWRRRRNLKKMPPHKKAGYLIYVKSTAESVDFLEHLKASPFADCDRGDALFAARAFCMYLAKLDFAKKHSRSLAEAVIYEAKLFAKNEDQKNFGREFAEITQKMDDHMFSMFDELYAECGNETEIFFDCVSAAFIDQLYGFEDVFPDPTKDERKIDRILATFNFWAEDVEAAVNLSLKLISNG